MSEDLKSRFIKYLARKLERIQNPPPIVGVLPLRGVIGSVSKYQSGLSLAEQAGLIEKVFSLPRLAAVALVINSPGGSPVQSALIQKRIRQWAAEKEIPVLAFVEDVAASGGYYLACAADEIFADESSIIGSIGVISAGFGFDRLIKKLGVDRRVYTEGKHKSILDPFQPEKEADIALLKNLQKDIHGNFKKMVKDRRGKKLEEKESILFSGEFWTAEKARKMGLIDAIGDIREICKERFGEKVEFKTVSREKGWLEKKFGLKTHLPDGEDFAEGALSSLEKRSLWARFGL